MSETALATESTATRLTSAEREPLRRDVAELVFAGATRGELIDHLVEATGWSRSWARRVLTGDFLPTIAAENVEHIAAERVEAIAWYRRVADGSEFDMKDRIAARKALDELLGLRGPHRIEVTASGKVEHEHAHTADEGLSELVAAIRAHRDGDEAEDEDE